MIYATGLPYAPHMYEMVTNVLTLPAGTSWVLASDPRRVYFEVLISGGVLPAFVDYTANGTGTGKPTVRQDPSVTFSKNWQYDYSLVTSEWYVGVFGAPVTAVVTEITFNPLTQQEIDHARLKPTSLRDKIKNYLSR